MYRAHTTETQPKTRFLHAYGFRKRFWDKHSRDTTQYSGSSTPKMLITARLGKDDFASSSEQLSTLDAIDGPFLPTQQNCSRINIAECPNQGIVAY